MVNTIPSTSTGRGTQQILFNVPLGQRPQIGSTRTITLTQARQMGLLAPGCRLQPVTPNSNSTHNKVCDNSHIKFNLVHINMLTIKYRI